MDQWPNDRIEWAITIGLFAAVAVFWGIILL